MCHVHKKRLFQGVEKKLSVSGLSPTLNSEISTQGRFSQVNVFDFNLNIINLPLRLLRAVEFATRSQEGRSRGRY